MTGTNTYKSGVQKLDSRFEVHDQPAEVVVLVLNPTAASLAIHGAVPDVGLIEKRLIGLNLHMHITEQSIERQSSFDTGPVRHHVETIEKVRSDGIFGRKVEGFDGEVRRRK